MKTEKFKVIQYIREFIELTDRCMDNFCKKEIEIKNKIRMNSFDLLEIAYEANVATNVEYKAQLLYKIIAKIKVIDFLLNLSYDKTIISKKQYLQCSLKLNDIAKYTNGWLASKERKYVPGPYNHFIIKEPKQREIVSQGMFDKTINHLVSRYILYPAILPCLLDINVASRLNMGIKAGLEYFYEYSRICKVKYGSYYILKCDIKKFFASIDHDILKEKLKKRIKDKDALKIVFDIIDSEDTPCGLGIGNMSSQIFAIFYLNDLDHFIKESLKIKYYTRYQDDFLLFHPSKEYLRWCLGEIEDFLGKEKLVLNKKTRIYKNTDNFIYLGRNSKGKYAKYRSVKRRIKGRFKLYNKGEINLNSLNSSLVSYSYLNN